ncbi:MAG: hypothetical protein M0C28_43255 [Candidatus Moduliflexus flocculans]|nr:hypothetical protein [Candidatus Moduliflexus flocculans]
MKPDEGGEDATSGAGEVHSRSRWSSSLIGYHREPAARSCRGLGLRKLRSHVEVLKDTPDGPRHDPQDRPSCVKVE